MICRQLLTFLTAVIPGFAAIICGSSIAAGPRATVGDESLDDATAVRAEFLQRLRRVADVGNLFSHETAASILDLELHATTIENDPPLSCAAHFSTTTLTTLAPSWFHPLPSGAGHMQIPAFTINPATVSGNPELSYEIVHYVFCSEWPRLQDGSEATLTFNGLPAFTCLTPSNIYSAIPESRLVIATDGVSLVTYQGRLDDDSGTTLTFNFRAGAACALSAEVKQDQEQGLRYRRAMYKFQTCRAAPDREFCATHPDVAWSDLKSLKEMQQNAQKQCGTLSSIYLTEPATGVTPPPLPQRFRKSPCDQSVEH